MRVHALFLTLGFSLLGGCDAAPTAGEGGATADEDRGGLGKADLVGSCELPNGNDLCGGPGQGNCWCDDLCVGHGDCCGDAGSVCGIEEPEPEGEPCGGFLGNTCSDSEYCAYKAGQYCGAADASSTCEPRPEACIKLYAPVCGCDGNTYSNSCFAASAGTGVSYEDECEPPPPGGFCGGIADIPCPGGQMCVKDLTAGCEPELGGADCGGVCVLDEPEACASVLCELFCENGFAQGENGCELCSCAVPEESCVVSGCNGEVCFAEPVATICVALPEHACFQDADCGHFADDGGCGWKQTEELKSCLLEPGGSSE